MAIDAEAVRRSVDLAELIGRHVRLRRSGKEHVGLCPFHNERTASFYVYSREYHCFGCGEHGDCFSWVMKIDGVNFPEAARRLGAGEIDAGELRRREAARRAERAARAAADRAARPWAWLRREWETQNADRWYAEIMYMREFAESADSVYLAAQWEREAERGA